MVVFTINLQCTKSFNCISSFCRKPVPPNKWNNSLFHKYSEDYLCLQNNTSSAKNFVLLLESSDSRTVVISLLPFPGTISFSIYKLSQMLLNGNGFWRFGTGIFSDCKSCSYRLCHIQQLILDQGHHQQWAAAEMSHPLHHFPFPFHLYKLKERQRSYQHWYDVYSITLSSIVPVAVWPFG